MGNGIQWVGSMHSSELETLSFPVSTKFLRSKDLLFTTSPAIGTYTAVKHNRSHVLF